MHFLQSKYWREVKEKLGNKTFDAGKVWFQTTKAPFLNSYIGYVPRAHLEDIDWDVLYEAGKKAGCAYISIDPADLKSEITVPVGRQGNQKLESAENRLQNIRETRDSGLGTNVRELQPGIPTHLQENAIIDISKTEEDLLANMKQKHRYNLKLAQKKGVRVEISDSEESFNTFLKLYNETVKRQNYFGRSENYLRTVWNVLRERFTDDNLQETEETQGSRSDISDNEKMNGLTNKLPTTDRKPLTTIATAYYEDKPLASWMLFLYGDTIYYPYGGSSDEHKNVMATYALLWGLIEWGKENGFRYIDLWGIESEAGGEQRATSNLNLALSSNPESRSTYDGFSRFKLGFGGAHIVYEDTVDLVINEFQYKLLKLGLGLREKFKFLKNFS